MLDRSPRTILAISAAAALTIAALAPTSALAKGPGNGPAGCDSDCTVDGPQAGQQVRARNGSGMQTETRANAGGGGQVQARAGNGRGQDRQAGQAVGNGNQGAGKGPNAAGQRGPGSCDQCDAEMGVLTDEQAAGLIFMANEEKLAHDVYAAFAEMYGARIFENIANSEARHQEAVSVVLERYGLEDSAIDLPTGEFSDPTIASLYETLIEQGAAGLDEAIGVGLLIEETDIADLESRMTGLDETAPDVYEMYSHLLAGSGNHLRAFQRWQA